MMEFLASSANSADPLRLVFLFGLIVFFGTAGARLMQRIHVPQVVGCVVVGVLFGPDVLDIIEYETVEVVTPFTMLALGFIGFMIGGELKADIFKKYGRQFFIILFSQGVGTFLFVLVGSSVAVWLLTRSITDAIAMGLVFGAIASATAPAATTNVLWEYKTRGPLTAAVLAIVALDDALALLLYKGAASGAQVLMGTAHDSVLRTVYLVFEDIAFAALLGFLAGLVLHFLLRYIRADDKVLGFSLALLLLVVGNAIINNIEPILPAMVFGITIANLARRQSKSIFDLVKKFSPPVYTAFFVLAGAHIQFGEMDWQTAAVTATYISFRVGGKIWGASFGAGLAKSPNVVRKYLGICLLPQAGVAIGLALVSSRLFGGTLGQLIILVVMTETFIIEILGPVLVKIGVKKAGEVGLNVTEEDLIQTYRVSDVADKEVPVIAAGMLLSEVIRLVSETSSSYYPVVNKDKKLLGAITLEGVRNTFATQELNDWLVALDVMEPVSKRLAPEMWLAEAFETARRLDVEYMPVTAPADGDRLFGVLDCRAVRRALAAEVLSRQQKADTIHGVQMA